jgi:hypothetical protein
MQRLSPLECTVGKNVPQPLLLSDFQYTIEPHIAYAAQKVGLVIEEREMEDFVPFFTFLEWGTTKLLHSTGLNWPVVTYLDGTD